MDKDQKRKAIPDIDEELMMNMMVDGVQKEGLQPVKIPDEELNTDGMASRVLSEDKSVGKEKISAKRKNEADYENIFFRKTDANARSGKAVYVRMEFHEKLSRIVQVIGEDKISLYTYLDNVLEYHFKEFGKDIIRSFNEKYKPIL